MRILAVMLFCLATWIEPAWAESLRLAWEPAPNAAGYVVYRSPVTAWNPVRLNAVPVTSCFFYDGTAEARQSYYYMVSAVDSSGRGVSYSAVLAATTGKYDATSARGIQAVRLMADRTVTPGEMVVLTGTAYDPEERKVSCYWTQILGPNVAIAARSGPVASFLAPYVKADTLLAFALAAAGEDGTTVTDIVQIIVRAGK